jgi:TonB-linked SusC/RagA family outer membrane protein
MKNLYILFAAIIITSHSSLAQITISGHAVDANTRQPISDVSIRLTPAGNTEVSNPDGFFLLRNVGTNDSLIFTHVGYIKRIVPAIQWRNQKDMLVELSPATNTLSEVIVSTGYQSIPKERSTGSFTLLDNKKISEQVSPDILSRLEPISSGLTFNRTTGATPQINIRGLSTINGPKPPLIVDDNFPYEGDITNINPNDVESITLLKDAAAASIWGTRAGNGVIVITTKKARFNQPLEIEVSANVTVGNKPDLSYTKPMSSNDYVDLEKQLFSNGFYDSNISSTSHPALSPVVELLLGVRNGTLSGLSANSQIDALRSNDVRNDFNQYFYQKSINQQYAATIKGGTADQSWLFATGYDRDVNSLFANYDRLNLRFQNTSKITKQLQLTTGLYYTQSKTTNGKPGYGDISFSGNAIYPYAKFADSNGNPLPFYNSYAQSYLATLGGGKLLDWNYYPLTDYTHISNRTTLQDVTGNLAATYRLFNFLSFNAQYQYERQGTDIHNLQDESSYQARSLANTYTQISPMGVVTYIVPKGGLLDLGSKLIESQNVRGQFNIDPVWGKNEVDAIAGAEIRDTHTNGNTNRLYGYNADNLSFGNIDLTKSYPNIATGSNTLIPDTKSLSDLDNRFVSVFANLAYTYDGRYTLSASGRRDASNIFGVNTNERWNPLGSVGLAWNITKENFYKLSWIPYLKLRATYGISGNVDLSRTALTTIRYGSTSAYTQSPTAVYSNYANPDLQWERVAMLNVGADFSILSDRISGSLEYYHKKGSNLYGTSLIDYTSGVGSTVTRNAAAMIGNGLDFVLNTRNTVGKLKWNTTINFSTYEDKITAYYLPDNSGFLFVSTTPVVSGLIDKPVYSVFSFRSAGLDPQTGDPRGYVNGVISKDYTTLYYNTSISDLKYSGPALPTKFGSVANTFNYGNWFLSLVFTYKLGYYFKRTTIDYSALLANGAGHSDYALRWQKPGDETHTTVPSFVYPDIVERDAFYTGSESLVEKGDHVRFQYFTAGYELKHSQLNKLPVKSLRLFINASNLGIVWRANNYHIDPDYNYSSSTLKPPLTLSIGIKSSL